MVVLKIESIDNYIYILKDEQERKYTLNLEFIDMEERVKVGDSICMKEELLDKKYEGYSKCYTFGNLESEYGKANLQEGDIDIIKVILDDKEITLKRLYG